MFRIIALLIGYGLGMIQTAYIVGRLSGIDIRDHGSKSAGFTNTNRVLGFKKGAIVFIIDVLKAVAAFLIARFIFSDYDVAGLYGAIGAVLGHVFPFYLKFKGGKGISCSLGLIIMLDWRIMLIAFIIGIIAVAATRFISVASLLITLLVPVLGIVFGLTWEVVGITTGLCALTWYLHRANIGRLARGQENKFSFRKK